jgi:branched-chain amino acid transport system substrate-binding protein
MTGARIGVAGPFSGPRSAYGNLLKAAAAANISPPARVVFGDDKANPEHAVTVAKSFVDAGVSCVVGHFNSECATAAGEIYRDNLIPFLLPASTKPGLASEIKAFRLCPTDDAQVQAIADWIRARHVAFAGAWADDTVYGRRLSGLFMTACSGTGITVAPIPGGGSTTIEPTVIAFFGAHHAVARSILDMRQRGSPSFALCCDDCTIDEFKELVEHQNDIFLAIPRPGFAEACEAAFRLLSAIGPEAGRIEVERRLQAHPAFSDYEAVSAGFGICAMQRAPSRDQLRA